MGRLDPLDAIASAGAPCQAGKRVAPLQRAARDPSSRSRVADVTPKQPFHDRPDERGTREREREAWIAIEGVLRAPRCRGHASEQTPDRRVVWLERLGPSREHVKRG